MAFPIRKQSVRSVQGTGLGIPLAAYPNAVATDAQLKIAINQLQTALRSPMSAGDTIMTVADPSGIQPDVLLSIDGEIVNVVAVSGNNVTIVRGFDGTEAVEHATNRPVLALIDAWHHNALASEVKAIETALGPNLGNVGGSGAGSITWYTSTNYDFAAQAPGGNLVVGANSITLAPVPDGVNGTNENHYLYVSGGTGTAEACEIIGGTAVAGTASGTVIIDCASAHTGAWTIRSATAGIQEALESMPENGGTVLIPAGTHTTYAPVTIDCEGARILGMTRNNVGSMILRTSGPIFNVKELVGSIEIAYLALRGGATAGVAAPADNIGIRLLENCVRGHYHDLMFDYLYGGILLLGGFHTKIDNIWAMNLSGYVIKHAGGVSPFIDTVSYDTQAPNDVPAEGGIVINASGAYIYNVDILHAHHGILVEATSAPVQWTFIHDAQLDQNFTTGVYIRNYSAHPVEGVFIHHLWSASAGTSGTLAGAAPGVADGFGLVIDGTPGAISEVVVDGGEIHNNRYSNIKILAGEMVKLHNLRLLETNLGNGADIDNIYVGSTGRIEIVECEIRGAAAGMTALRSGVLAAPPVTELIIRNNRFEGSWAVAPVHDLSTGSKARIDGFNRGMDELPLTLPAAATLILNPRQYFHITGTGVAIENLVPFWQGRKVYLFKPDTGTWTMNTSGNIQSPTGTPGTILTVDQGESVICEFSGNKWMCRQ